jgi:hypothetical protein
MVARLLVLLSLVATFVSVQADSKSKKVEFMRPEILLDEEDGDIQTGIQRNVRAGFVSTFTQKFFTDYNTLLMDFLVQKMRTMELIDICNEHAIGQFFSAFMCTTDTKLSVFDIDTSASNLLILDDQKALSLIISGVNIMFDFGFEIKSEPDWLQDEGTGMFKVSDASITINLHPT